MGAIFAATDSVATLQVLDRSRTPGLFSLVFGEGVVNDAVSVVLLGAVANTARAEAADGSGGGRRHGFAGGFVLNFIYLLITSLIMGAAAGLGIAMALKRLPLTDAHQVRKAAEWLACCTQQRVNFGKLAALSVHMEFRSYAHSALA